MKYIAARLDNQEFIVIFPTFMNHDYFWDAVKTTRFDIGVRDWERKLYKAELIGAGFIRDGKCYGRSETLGVDSRGDLDSSLIKKNGFINHQEGAAP
jgi:hypothetical protein